MSVEETFQAFGAELQQARIAKGRSLDDIASLTKIHRRHLEAIEAGDVTRLPQGPYVKAFVREYARAVGMTVPDAFAIPEAGPARSHKDPKVVSRPVGSPASQKESGTHDEYGLPAVARETARKANTAVKSAVKTVTKTTESVVNLVESSSKEALEVLTSKSLWDEAEVVRRERLGLPPLERPAESKPKQGAPIEEKQLENRTVIQQLASLAPSSPPYAPAGDASTEVGQSGRLSIGRLLPSSKRATNIVIALLALLFVGAAYFAIRMSHTQSSVPPTTDYVPAPVEKPVPPTVQKHEKPTPTVVTPVPSTARGDSLHFVLRALQPVWVSISPDGIPAYRGEMKAGDVRSFLAASKIVINLGNQKSVDMQFNGQHLSNLPAIQNSSVVVRDLVLMRDRVTLGGEALDLKKLTSTPPHSQQSVAVVPLPAARPSVTPPEPNANGASPTNLKPPVQSPTTHVAQVPPKGATQEKPKAQQPTAVPKPAKKSAKKTQPPPGEIHTVEPIPPRL